jgi:hypothetical protein
MGRAGVFALPKDFSERVLFDSCSLKGVPGKDVDQQFATSPLATAAPSAEVWI